MTTRITNIALALILFFIALPQASADKVRKVVRQDGSIVFTNATKKSNKNVAYTNQADSGTRIYKYKDSKGVTSFSDQTPVGRPYTIFRVQCFACDPASKVNWNKIGLNLSDFSSIINRVAKKHGVDPALIRALIHAESGFNPSAISKQGAQGLMQLMPATARQLGVRDAMDARQNITGGVTYLAQLLKQFDGDIRLASAAYNAGPNAVKKYAGVPPYAETRTYVKRVKILHKRYQAALKVGS
jgi:soluble lytic murein transglycosylase-like protein